MDKREIYDFIKRQKITVISTISKDNKPESAVIEFAETENLDLIFDTFSTSRKYKNLKENPYASFVIGWDENITVQYEGVASEIKGEELETYKAIYFAKNSRAKRWEERENITYFKVIPKWIRYSDLRMYPWKIYELKL